MIAAQWQNNCIVPEFHRSLNDKPGLSGPIQLYEEDDGQNNLECPEFSTKLEIS